MRKKQLDLTLGRLSATNISALKTWNRKHLRCCHNLPSEDQEPGTPIGRRRYRTLTKKKKSFHWQQLAPWVGETNEKEEAVDELESKTKRRSQHPAQNRPSRCGKTEVTTGRPRPPWNRNHEVCGEEHSKHMTQRAAIGFPQIRHTSSSYCWITLAM